MRRRQLDDRLVKPASATFIVLVAITIPGDRRRLAVPAVPGTTYLRES
jgi:hypothetical protein